jgi:hypothetical protein
VDLNGLPKFFRVRQNHLQNLLVPGAYVDAFFGHGKVSWRRARQGVLTRLETRKFKSPALAGGDNNPLRSQADTRQRAAGVRQE